jgi:hypothetical protein
VAPGCCVFGISIRDAGKFYGGERWKSKKCGLLRRGKVGIEEGFLTPQTPLGVTWSESRLNYCDWGTIYRALRGRLVGEALAHFVGVDAAQVVALDGGFGCVAVTLPEGDGSGIFYGGFEEDGVDAVELEFFFHGSEKGGAQAFSAVRFGGVESDDVG